jgi:hypothetical protein
MTLAYLPITIHSNNIMAVLATSNTAVLSIIMELELNTRIRACSHIGTWQAMLKRIESFTCWKLGMTLELLPTEGRKENYS